MSSRERGSIHEADRDVIIFQSPEIIAVCSLVIFLAALNAGLTGIGYALISLPILIIFLPPKPVVSIILILSIILNLIVLIEARRSVDLRRIWTLIAAGVVGMPFGTHLLKVADVNLLKVLIGAVITGFALALMKGFSRKVKHEKLALLPVGLTSGFLNGATAICGPPVILFFTNQGMEKQAFRANVVAYFLILNMFTIPYFILNGLITPPIIQASLTLAPAMILGAVSGIIFSRRVREDIFRRIVLIIVALTGLFSIAAGLRLL